MYKKKALRDVNTHAHSLKILQPIAPLLVKRATPVNNSNGGDHRGHTQAGKQQQLSRNRTRTDKITLPTTLQQFCSHFNLFKPKLRIVVLTTGVRLAGWALFRDFRDISSTSTGLCGSRAKKHL